MTGTMSPTEELFTIAAVWTLVALGVSFFIKHWAGRAVFVIALVGTLFWELPYGYYNFRTLCSENISIEVREKIQPQKSICVKNLDSGLFSGLVATGFDRIEVLEKSDDHKRDLKSGRVVRVSANEIASTYCLESTLGVSLPWRILRNDRLVVRASDKKIAARHSDVIWKGMAWQEAMHPVLGVGGICENDPSRIRQMLIDGSGE